MHVEFRLCQISRICAFDTESFYRMNQLLLSQGGSVNSDAKDGDACLPSTRGLNTSAAAASSTAEWKSRLLQLYAYRRSAAAAGKGNRLQLSSEYGTNRDTDDYAPVMRLQFILEHLVKIESSCMQPQLDRQQHEKQIKTSWDGSEVRTRRYTIAPLEAIIASLPMEAADATVKIRLIQLPPPLRNAREERYVEQVVNESRGPRPALQLRDMELCLGVAKITLKELITIRGGVCISLQPKRSMTSLVEELNLNTVATDGMFGKDVGGSASLVLQAIAYTFSCVPVSTLLLLPDVLKSRNSKRSHCTTGSESTSLFGESASNRAIEDARRKDDPRGLYDDKGCVRPLHSLRGGGDAFSPSGTASTRAVSLPSYRALGQPREDTSTSLTGYSSQKIGIVTPFTPPSVHVGRFDSTAVRFVLIPYVAIIDTLLCINDALSWRRPLKTLTLLLAVLLALSADVLDVTLMTCCALGLLRLSRTIAMLYRVPHLGSSVTPLVSVDEPSGAPVQAYLYGRRNVLLNAMVRARLFFLRGLQEDSYYELVLVFHVIRRRQRSILLSAAFLCLLLTALSLDSLVVCSVLSVFLLYPMTLHLSLPLLQRKKKKKPLSMLTLWRAFLLGRPMRVSRLVQVSVVRSSSSMGALLSTEANAINARVQGSEGPPSSSASLAHRYLDYALPSIVPDSKGGFASGIAHRRAHTCTDGEFLLSRPDFVNERQRRQTASHLSFALVSFNCDSGGGSGVVTSTGPLLEGQGGHSRGIHCKTFVSRMRRQLESARQLHNVDIEQAPQNKSGKPNHSTRGARPPSLADTVPPGDDKRRVAPGSTTIPATGNSSRDEVFQKFFSDTLSLLSCIRRISTFQPYVTPTSLLDMEMCETVRLDVFARCAFLLEVGEDDGVTSTILAMQRNTVAIGKLPHVSRFSNEARTMALLAAYLLQGARLSLYCPGVGAYSCSVILPLKSRSIDVVRLPQPNPCPEPLLNALEQIWKGLALDMSKDDQITISVDMVLQIIATYKESWNIGSAAHAARAFSTTMHPRSFSESRYPYHTAQRSISLAEGKCVTSLRPTPNPNGSFSSIPHTSAESEVLRDQVDGSPFLHNRVYSYDTGARTIGSAVSFPDLIAHSPRPRSLHSISLPRPSVRPISGRDDVGAGETTSHAAIIPGERGGASVVHAHTLQNGRGMLP